MSELLKLKREVDAMQAKVDATEYKRREAAITEAVEAAVRKAGLVEPARIRAAVALLRGNVSVADDDAPPTWTDGSSVGDGVQKYLRTDGSWLLKEQATGQSKADAKPADPAKAREEQRREIGERLRNALAPEPQSDWTRQAIGRALAEHL